MLTMQEALACLDDYWTKQGCVKLQPMNTEVGAGTMNPATFLRVLGPEPWHVAYAEPSVRPDDSRYGKNPNRIQTHTQYQVILKPEPGDPQELYLGSLEALGIDVRAHDIRFVEDNWASPALGAWGQGWEVWLDGLEITQFTYFQQAGGIVLDPVSVELTYGMERIMMALQDVRHFKEISYTDSLSYGELYGQAEYEMSRYYLDEADVAANRQLLTIYAGEARRLIAAGCPSPPIPTSSSALTPSTCSMREGPCRLQSAPPCSRRGASCPVTLGGCGSAPGPGRGTRWASWLRSTRLRLRRFPSSLRPAGPVISPSRSGWRRWPRRRRRWPASSSAGWSTTPWPPPVSITARLPCTPPPGD